MSDEKWQAELPEWVDFRDPEAGEELVQYLYQRMRAESKQHRDRDHWLNDQVSAIFSMQDALHFDLIGDGTPLKPGILTEILRKQKQMPDEVANAIKDSHRDREAKSYSVLKKWLWGVLGGVTVAVIGGLTLLALTGHR